MACFSFPRPPTLEGTNLSVAFMPALKYYLY